MNQTKRPEPQKPPAPPPGHLHIMLVRSDDSLRPRQEAARKVAQQVAGDLPEDAVTIDTAVRLARLTPEDRIVVVLVKAINQEMLPAQRGKDTYRYDYDVRATEPVDVGECWNHGAEYGGVVDRRLLTQALGKAIVAVRKPREEYPQPIPRFEEGEIMHWTYA